MGGRRGSRAPRSSTSATPPRCSPRVAAARPDVVVHTAYRMTTRASTSRARARSPRAAVAAGARLVHLSSDLVFPGTGDAGADRGRRAAPGHALRRVQARGRAPVPARRAARAHVAHLRRRASRRRRSGSRSTSPTACATWPSSPTSCAARSPSADLAAAVLELPLDRSRPRPPPARCTSRAPTRSRAWSSRASCAPPRARSGRAARRARRPRPAQAPRPRLLAGARPAARAPARRARGPGGVRAVVVGAGVVGLTTAVRLREAGIDADVVARDEPPDTTSAVAAALWYPYRALPAERVTAWSAADLRTRWPRSPSVAGSGVRMLAGTERLAPDAPDPWWRDGGAGPASARARACASSRPSSTCRSTCRGWSARLRALGGTRRAPRRRLARRARGRRRGQLRGPRRARAGRRRVADRGARAGRARGGARRARVAARPVRPASSSSTSCRASDDVVLGGTARGGRRGPHAPTRRPPTAIRARCAALVPALRDAPVVDVAVGLRPARPAVRLEAEGRVVHCYGHGGAGVTLAWGCAGEVAALLGPGGRRYAAPR